MIKNEVTYDYFEWLYEKVCDEEYSRRLSYRKLLEYLFSTDFTYILPMDENRAEDGLSLRYRFAMEVGYKDETIEGNIDFPCSVLEMIIALSIRCEEHIMSDPDIGDRTGQWFWNMIVNLGLGNMSDDNFNKQYVKKIIKNFLDRHYEKNGRGGLFMTEDSSKDMRDIEIWYQMCMYLIQQRGE